MYKVSDYSRFRGNCNSLTILNIKDMTVMITPAVDELMYGYLYRRTSKMKSIKDVVDAMIKFNCERRWYAIHVYSDRRPYEYRDEDGCDLDYPLLTSYYYKDQYLEVYTDTPIHSISLKNYLLSIINHKFLSEHLNESEYDIEDKISDMIGRYYLPYRSARLIRLQTDLFTVECDVIPNERPRYDTDSDNSDSDSDELLNDDNSESYYDNPYDNLVL